MPTRTQVAYGLAFMASLLVYMAFKYMWSVGGYANGFIALTGQTTTDPLFYSAFAMAFAGAYALPLIVAWRHPGQKFVRWPLAAALFAGMWAMLTLGEQIRDVSQYSLPWQAHYVTVISILVFAGIALGLSRRKGNLLVYALHLPLR